MTIKNTGISIDGKDVDELVRSGEKYKYRSFVFNNDPGENRILEFIEEKYSEKYPELIGLLKESEEIEKIPFMIFGYLVDIRIEKSRNVYKYGGVEYIGSPEEVYGIEFVIPPTEPGRKYASIIRDSLAVWMKRSYNMRFPDDGILVSYGLCSSVEGPWVFQFDHGSHFRYRVYFKREE